MSDDKRHLLDGYTVQTWSNSAGAWYPVHDHSYDKIILVKKGAITFYYPARKEEHVLHAGDHLQIPARTDHSATVGPEGVTCAEGQRTPTL